MKQHTTGLENKQKKSVIYQHLIQHHPNLERDRSNYTMKVTGTHHSALGRQAEEGVLIMEEVRTVDRIASISL